MFSFDKSALRIINGCINSKNNCIGCTEVIRWGACVEKNCEINKDFVKAEAIAFKSASDGNNAYIDVDIIVKCTDCGLTNKFYAKYKKQKQ